MTRNAATNYMLGIVVVILVMIVFKVAQAIIVPLVMSVFLAMMLMPVIRWLTARHVPLIFASLISLAIVMLGLVVMGSVLTMSLQSFQHELPRYVRQVREFIATAVTLLQSHGLQVKYTDILAEINPADIMGLVGRGMFTFMALLKNVLLMFFFTLFMLLESHQFGEKALRAYDGDSILLDSAGKISQELQRYILFKTLISLATGLLVWAFLAIVGVDFSLLWGLLAFVLNFIPSVGSILASIPPVLLTLLQFDNPLVYAIVVLLGLSAIQMTIGNYLEPRIMGQSLNVSTLMVFISMVFWGWMWGVVGMVLAVPLMVCIKVIISHIRSLRTVAILLEG